MNELLRRFNVPIWVLFLVGFVILALVSAYLFQTVTDPKWHSLATGILSGTLVALLGFFSTIYPLKKLQHFNDTGLVDLLSSRHDKNYYQPYLQKAKEQVLVMGSTCSRFFHDFLDEEADEHVLLDGIQKNKNFRIRLLIPDDDNQSAEGRNSLEFVIPKLKSLVKKHPDRIQIRRFSSKARHSFVISDDHFIGGPIFEGDASKNSPAVHVRVFSNFAQKHVNYFNRVWEESVDIVES